jgi:DNA polymerase II small subunit/DNA polymerase delta subunit B
MDLVKEFLKKGMLISPELKEKLKPDEVETMAERFNQRDVVLTEEIYSLMKISPVKVLEEYKREEQTRKITKFVDFYNHRFEFLRELLQKKLELKELTSINKLNLGEVVVIGMVRDAKKDGFDLEDSTGSVPCVCQEKVLEDEVIAVKGVYDRKKIQAEKVTYPDIPLSRKVNTTKNDVQVLFTQKLSPSREHVVPYIFTFDINPKNMENPNSWIVTKKDKPLKGKRNLNLNLPFKVEVKGIRIFVLEYSHMEEAKKRLGVDDEKKIIIALLKRRHFLPFIYFDKDPYLIGEVPDIIFLTGGKENFFLNYKGVSVVSVSGGGSFLVNLKTRDYKEIKND